MPWMAIISLISQVAGQAAAASASSMDREKAMALIKASVDEFGKINVPKLQELFLKKLPDTQLAGIKDDPAYRAQQLEADAQLNDVIDSGGLTLADQAALNSIRGKISRSESAGRHAIENQMAARGTLDSGAQLSMQLANQQNSAQNLAEQGERTAGDAQERMYRAIQQRAQNAGAGLDRNYRQQSNAAAAQDAINRGNTEIANTAMKYNAAIPQQEFDNQMRLTAAKMGPNYALAGAHAGAAANAKEDANASAQLAGAAVNTFGNLAQSQGQSQSQGANYGGNDYNSYNAYGDRGSPSDLTGGHTDALMGQPTRSKVLLGYDENGRPVYGARRA